MSALPPGVKAAPFYRESFGLFCGRPHPLYGRRDLAEADLSGLPAVSFQTDREGDVLETVTAQKLDSQSTALYGTASLWDDGLIDPRDTRKLLGFLLDICAEAAVRPLNSNTFGVARL